jgi:hypothetical protein
MKQAFQNLKKQQTLILLTVALLPIAWNACGNKNFESNTFGSTGNILCTSGEADLTNCDTNDSSINLTSQTAVVKANRDVDILFVVDNSGSMSEEQVGIGSKIGGFLNKISSLNWQIALTTTDTNQNTLDANGNLRAWGDGMFRPFESDYGSQFVLKATELSPSAAQTKLSNGIAVGIKGSGDERGISATYRAIQRSNISGSMQSGFFRKDARLAVIAISDEDECSIGPAAGCSSSTASVPQNLVNLVQQTFGTSKVFSFNSIVLDSSCTTGGVIGTTYHILSNMTGGAIAPVCATDYAAPLAAIGNKVVDLLSSVSLSCIPQDVTKDGKPDLAVITNDGSIFTDGFEINGANVTFTPALDEGTYELKYYCKD